MDVLADALSVAGVRGTVAATVDAGENWGLRLNAVDGAAFHAITSGTAWLRVADRAPSRLMPGDVVLFPTGAPHALSSDTDTALTRWEHYATGAAFDAHRVVQVGAPPVQTRILCASYRHDPAVATPVLTLLPDVLHVRADAPDPALADTVRMLARELATPQPATTIVLDRLVDILLIQLLRTWLRSDPGIAPVSWLRALGDPTIAAALAAIHADPAHRWTLDTLADAAAVSRATLARRFDHLVGETPTAYLTRWRMDLAARRLRDTDDPIEHIAHSIGYDSVYAFSKAFSRARNLPPGRYRTISRTLANHDA